MNTTTALKWAAIGILIVNLTTSAQSLGSGSETSLGGSQGGTKPQQHQRPSPEQAAKHLMGNFDANKDGELDQSELTQALESLRAHRQQHGCGGHGGGSSNSWHHASNANTQGGADAQTQHRTPPSADQVAAHLIKKYSADGKGLTEAELTQVIAARRAKHAQHSGQNQGGFSSSGAGGSLHGSSQSTSAKTSNPL